MHARTHTQSDRETVLSRMLRATNGKTKGESVSIRLYISIARSSTSHTPSNYNNEFVHVLALDSDNIHLENIRWKINAM